MTAIDIEKQNKAPRHDEFFEGTPASTPDAISQSETEFLRREKDLVRKQDKRLIPLCAFIYFLCYLDRSNIGNARTLNADTGDDLLTTTNMTQYQYIIALMAFLVAYSIFEAPSNVLLKRTSPSKWIAFLMFSWGAITIGIGGAQNFATVTALRFLLGVFEAGLFPGLVYYTTFWYKSNETSLRVAIFFASATLAGAFGGALAYGIGHMNQVHGLPGWRWLFILEGIPSVLSAFLVYFILPDYPETASWLTVEEKELARSRLDSGSSSQEGNTITWASAKETLLTWRLYIHYLVFSLASPPFSSLSLFTPTLTAGLGFRHLEAQLMTVPPYAAAYVAMILSAVIADRYNARGVVAGVAALVGVAGYIGSATLSPSSYNARYGCLIVAASGTFSSVSPLLGWLAGNTFSTGVTGLAIALNISFAAPGQITGVWIYKANEAKIGFPTGHWTNSGCLLGLAVLSFSLTLYYRWLNAKIVKSGAEGQRLFLY